MNQQSWFYECTQKNWKQGLQQMPVSQSSQQHQSQQPKVESTQMSINCWMEKLCVVHSYNAVFFRHKKEWRIGTCYSVDVEKEMATHCSILAWEASWTEDPGRLQPIGSQKVGHEWSDLAHTQLKIQRKLCNCGLDVNGMKYSTVF